MYEVSDHGYTPPTVTCGAGTLESTESQSHSECVMKRKVPCASVAIHFSDFDFIFLL
jgi:hypothetical protein